MKNILIYRTGSLGDTIVALPALQIIRNKNPNSKIYYLHIKNHDSSSVSPVKIFKNLQLIDRFIEINNINSLVGFYTSFKILKKIKIKKLYYLNEDRPINKKIRDFIFFKILLNCKILGLSIFRNNNCFYEGYYLANKIQKISFKNLLSINELLKKKFKASIKLDNFFKLRNYITISPGGRIPSKRWKIDNWKILIKKIISKNKNIKIIILGTKKDKYQNYEISKIFKKNVLNFTGKTTLDKLTYILNFTNLHICHDDGTMHLSILLNKKVLSIFHNIDFKKKWFQAHNKKQIQLYSLYGIESIKVEKVMHNFSKLKKIKI